MVNAISSGSINMQTIEQKAAYLREWRVRNKDYNAKRYARDPDKYRAKAKTYYENVSPQRKEQIKALARERGKLYYQQKLKAARVGLSKKIALAMYGLTSDEFEILFESQNRKCAVCGTEKDSGRQSRRMNVDHCHESGVIRGILCTNCNTKLGWYERHRAAIHAYLGARND